MILFLHTAAYKGDRQCDDKNNNCGCDWDGGDCCGSSAGVSYCSQCKCLDPDYDGTKCKRTSLNEHLLSGQTPTDQYFIRVECILHINLYFEIRCTEPPFALSLYIYYILPIYALVNLASVSSPPPHFCHPHSVCDALTLCAAQALGRAPKMSGRETRCVTTATTTAPAIGTVATVVVPEKATIIATSANAPIPGTNQIPKTVPRGL